MLTISLNYSGGIPLPEVKSQIANAGLTDTIVYAFITDIQLKGTSTTLDLDYIQYFSGPKAVREASLRGEADTVWQDGKMIVAIPGDRYIVNQSKKIRRFKIGRGLQINLQLNPDSIPPILENNLENLARIHAGSLFKIAIVGRRIVRVTEIFIP